MLNPRTQDQTAGETNSKAEKSRQSRQDCLQFTDRLSIISHRAGTLHIKAHQAAPRHSSASLLFITRGCRSIHTEYTAAAPTSAVFIITADAQQEIDMVVVDLIKQVDLLKLHHKDPQNLFVLMREFAAQCHPEQPGKLKYCPFWEAVRLGSADINAAGEPSESQQCDANQPTWAHGGVTLSERPVGSSSSSSSSRLLTAAFLTLNVHLRCLFACKA
ncbi:unnamed protein product [Pleuronectes platessa]|uniref:Uncharacterized protein n=1 Tax=Pleuronectes platessa TaxID=8262 RepID=A0A9N7UII8_PLEPL|nr:unnamed protein product [Pleuronectes platessa]